MARKLRIEDPGANSHVVHRSDRCKPTFQHDRVTTPGTGVDTTVLRVTRAYDFRGVLESVKSYDHASPSLGNVVNEARFSFNEFLQLVKDEQAHDAAVTTGTPAVQYGFATGGDNHIRPTTQTYPNGRVLNFSYAG